MKIQLDADMYMVARTRKNRAVLDVQVFLDTEKLPPSVITRIKNALKKGYYGSGSESAIGVGLREISRDKNLPFIFCNRAYWTSGLTFYNIPKTDQLKVKEYVKNMANVAGLIIEQDRYHTSKFDVNYHRWSVAVKDERNAMRRNANVRAEFAAILKGSMTYYQREIMTKEQKQQLVATTKEF